MAGERLFQQISQGLNVNPVGAFLIGRENRRQRERQENIDVLNTRVAESGIASREAAADLNRASTERIKGEPAAQAAALARQQLGNIQVAKAVFDNPDIPKNLKNQVLPMIMSGDDDAKKEGMDLIQDFLKPRSAPVTNINLPAGVDEGTNQLFKGIGDRANVRIDQAQTTFQNDADLDRVSLALTRGAQTGFGENVLLDLKSAANTFLGINFSPEDREGEVVRAIGNRLALQLRNPASGLGLTGNTSNRDLTFLKESVVNLEKTEKGNVLLIDVAKRMNKFKRDLVDEQGRLIQASNNTIPANLDTELIKFANSYQLFTPQEKAEMQRVVEEGRSVVDRLEPKPDGERQQMIDAGLSPADADELLLRRNISSGQQ